MHQTSLEQLAIMQRRLEQLEIENQQLRSQVFALNRADNGTGPEFIPHNTIVRGVSIETSWTHMFAQN